MSSNGDRKRVVITGAGAICAVGNDTESTWSAMLAGDSGGALIQQFQPSDALPVRIAGEVKDFDPELYIERKEARRYDRFTHFAMGAAVQSMTHAGLDGCPSGTDPDRFGVIFGSGIGGINTLEANYRALIEKGPRRVSPFFIPMFIPDIAAGLISIRVGAMAVNYASVSACASGAHAIGEAFRHLQRGDVDIMIAGGAESTITELTMAGFAAMKAMSTRNDDPATASRPFCATRNGFMIGEGAGSLVLETLEHATARGATPLAELVGYGASADAYHITAPVPGGAGAQHAMRKALEDAGADASDVDYVNAHGTSTPMNDQIETAAVKAVLGDHARDIVMGSTKSMTGHLLGASGALEAFVCSKVVAEGRIPSTINFHEPDPDCDLEYAHGGVIERDVGLALSNSFGFGGHNVCLAIRRWDG